MSVLALPNPDRSKLSIRAKALVFEDPRSRELLQRIESVAPSHATVLITGETGTGKEIVARHIHELSHRRSGPFVAVNCGAFSEQLVESELFGHERGAFTGALNAQPGWFEAAHGGTLFLDEIGDLPPAVQVKLLRVLQEGEVVRIGSRQPRRVDVRLVAATNVDLAQAMAAGHFREDLFYRLNVTPIALAPLRERRGDILPLARYFLELYQRRVGVDTVELTEAATRALLCHPWPGNIRELENAIHHALLVCQGGEIAPRDLGLVSARTSEKGADKAPTGALEAALIDLFERNLPNLHEHIEGVVMRTAYRYCSNNQLQTARLLGVSRNIVRARLIHHGELTGAPRSSPPRAAGSEPTPASSRPPPPPAPAPLRVVRIGYQKFGLLTLVKLHGALDAALAARGIRVEWVEFPAGLPIVEALRTEQLALGVVGECPPVVGQAADIPLVYLAAHEPAPESEAIIVPGHSTIRSVADLRGKTVALSRGANVHYLLIRALEEANLLYEDIRPSFLSPDAALRAFTRGEVDAWAIWDPVLAGVLWASGARVLRDGRGIANNVAYYVAGRRFAEQHPDLVDRFLHHVESAGQWARDNAEAVTELLAQKLSVPSGVLALALRRNLVARPLDEDLLAQQQEIADTLHRMQVIPRAVKVSEAQWRANAGALQL